MSDPVTSPAPFAPGSVIADKYRVEGLLGEGGMGVVVKATHLLLDEPVAIKFLRSEFVSHEEIRSRFMREAKAAIRIKGPHVLRMLDVDLLPDGAPFLVMEFLEGKNLEELLDERRYLPMQEAVDAVIQACDAVATAHHRGVIHRDIKPANLFLTTAPSGQPQVKVLDFGISKLVGERVERLTRTMTTMGSALYMSPEQLKSTRDVDARTDIYALGVTLFQLLTGQFPFLGESMPQLVAAILAEEPKSLARLRPDLPTELCAVVHRAFAREPGERQPTAAALAGALAPFASSDMRALALRLTAQPREAMLSDPSLADVPVAAQPSRTRSDTTVMASDANAAAPVRQGEAAPASPARPDLPAALPATAATMTRSDLGMTSRGSNVGVAVLVGGLVLALAATTAWWMVRHDEARPSETVSAAEPGDSASPSAADTLDQTLDDEPLPTATASASASLLTTASAAASTPPTSAPKIAPRPRPRAQPRPKPGKIDIHSGRE